MPALIQVNDLQYVVDWRGSVRNIPIFLRPFPKQRPKSPNAHHPKATIERGNARYGTWNHGRLSRMVPIQSEAWKRDDEPTLFDMPAMQTRKPTVDELEHGRSTREQLAQWGVSWPPRTRMETQTPARGEKTREGHQLNDTGQARPLHRIIDIY